MFKGAYTAIVTPFGRNGDVDFSKLEDLIERQIEGGVDGIVPVGTTGESPSLSVDEHLKVIKTTVQKVAGRVKVIAGTGANSTAEAVEMTKEGRDLGIDGTLQVTPYYNKPSQAGLLKHFSAVADVGVPVVLYNVPGRSSREIAIETIVELALHPKIVAVKEAAGSVDRVSSIVRQCDLDVLSGDDGLAFPMMSVGGVGVVSVTSNICPQAVSDMVHAALDGDWDKGRALHLKYHKLFGNIFLDTNPIPVKAALAMMGLIEEVYRLPICSMTEDKKAVLRESLSEFNLI